MTMLVDRPRPVVPDVHRAATRREFVLGGVAAGLLVAAGCGSDDQPATAPPSAVPGGAFPVTIDHRYGTTTVASEPVSSVSTVR